MKLKYKLALALIALPTLAAAGPFGLPDHVRDGYRDTGCDELEQVQITNDAGDYLYSNNPTCPKVGGAPDDLTPAPVVVEEEPEEEEDPVEECKGGDCDLASVE
jgi:hypothetical protein